MWFHEQVTTYIQSHMISFLFLQYMYIFMYLLRRTHPYISSMENTISTYKEAD